MHPRHKVQQSSVCMWRVQDVRKDLLLPECCVTELPEVLAHLASVRCLCIERQPVQAQQGPTTPHAQPKLDPKASQAKRQLYFVGLSLLGFKPASCLKPWHTWRQSNFVYPDERTMPGSVTAFIALHEAMLTQDRAALCTYVRSRNTEPRLVALAAAQEVKDEYGAQVSRTCADYPASAQPQEAAQTCGHPCCSREVKGCFDG